MKLTLIVLGAVIGLFLTWALVRTPSPEEREKSSARRAIEMCWDEQKRKSLSPESARFIAGSCELLETRFKEKYQLNP